MSGKIDGVFLKDRWARGEKVNSTRPLNVPFSATSLHLNQLGVPLSHVPTMTTEEKGEKVGGRGKKKRKLFLGQEEERREKVVVGLKKKKK